MTVTGSAPGNGSASEQPTARPADDQSRPQPAQPAIGNGELGQRQPIRLRIQRLIRAVNDSDQETVDEVIKRMSHSRRWAAPLALTVGALGMLLVGVKLLFTNWRLTLIQVLPAMWIWAAMYDLKLHLLSRNSFHVLHGPVLIPIVLAIAAVTAASFFLNAVFAYAIARPGRPRIRPAFTQARSHLVVVLGSGTVVGVLLGVATMVVSRWGAPWFTLSLGIVIAVMMICYVAVPARLIGAKTTSSKRDSLTASMVGGAIGAVVCTPPYVLGRLGLLMLGSHTLFALGVIVFALGLILQAGATGAVKVIKMSAKLVSGPGRGVGPRRRDPE